MIVQRARVVPANAGTHTPRPFLLEKADNDDRTKRRWLWVPAPVRNCALGRDDGESWDDRESCPYPSARSSRRSTFPVAVIGSVSANCTKRGYSWAASCTLTNS